MSTTNQVIEFELGGERFCIDVAFVSEVVRIDREALTAVPNAPRYVEGVVDLRGKTATVIDPYVLLNVSGELEDFGQLLVFDDERLDGEQVGWLVEDVYRVRNLEPDRIEETPAQHDAIRGVVNNEDGFVIWTSPDRALG